MNGSKWEGQLDEAERIPFLMSGVVVDRLDPKGLGRVRVRVPGFYEPASPWARPLSVGSGSANRGLFSSPAVGAEVAILFLMGDRDRPVYLGGFWGAPAGVSEVPEDAQVLDDDGNPAEPDSHVFSSGTLSIEFREVENERRVRIRDAVAGDILELDAETHTITIRASTGIVLESSGQIEINGLNVAINGRPVRSLGGSI